MEDLLRQLNFTRKTFLSLIVLVFLLISLPVALYLSQQQQTIKSRAQECYQVCDSDYVCDQNYVCDQEYVCDEEGNCYYQDSNCRYEDSNCREEQINCREECTPAPPVIGEDNPPPEEPGETGGEVIGGIVDNVCQFFDNFLPGEQCGGPQYSTCGQEQVDNPGYDYCNDPANGGFNDNRYLCDPLTPSQYGDGCYDNPDFGQEETNPEVPQEQPTNTEEPTNGEPNPSENQPSTGPLEIAGIETYLNGQSADLGAADIEDDDTVGVLVHASTELGQDYACRWNFDDGQGDSGPQDCQISRQFSAGFNSISVYLVNAAGEESDRKNLGFIVTPPPQISSIDTYINSQLTNLSGRQVTVGNTVGVVVNVPAELGNNYACRFNVDGSGDSDLSDCQLTQSFDIGTHSISVYVVNNKGKQSQSQSISFSVVEPPSPPVISGGQSRAPGTQIVNIPAEYQTIEEKYTCGVYLVCESDGGYNTTGYAGKYYTNVTSNYTGSNVGCPPNSRIYTPDVCPVDQRTVGTKHIPDETFSSTRSYQVKAAQTLYQCEYTQESVVYDCSNGQKCYNDHYSDESTQCILKPKTPHYHCDRVPDPQCEGRGLGWIPSQATCAESFTKEPYACFDGKRWYNDYRRAPDTNCAWDKTGFHPEQDPSCRTTNLTSTCQKKTDCQRGYYCQTDTGICLQETEDVKATIPEFESAIPILGGVLNGLGAVKDGAGNLVSGTVSGVGGAVSAVAEDPGVILDTLGNAVEFVANLPGDAVELVANAPVFYQGDQTQVREQTQDGLARIIEANAVDKAIEAAEELVAANSAACADFTSSYLSANPQYQGRPWEEYWFQMPQNSPCHRTGMVISQDKVDEAVTNITSIGPLQTAEEEPTDEQKEPYRQQTLEAFKESLKILGYDYDAAAETRVIGTCLDAPTLPGGQALSVIGSALNLPGVCFTTERLVPTDPSTGYIAVAKKEQAMDLAKQLGLDWDNPQTWTDAQTKLFFNTLANRDVNFAKTAIEGVIGLPITTHEDMEVALSLCRQVHGNLCELDSTNGGVVLELTNDEYQKAVNLYKANGDPNFQPADLDLVQRFVAIPGATTLGIQDDYGRRVAEQRIASELGISVDEVRKVEASFNVLDWVGDVTRSGTEEGRAFETKFNERNTEAAINIVTNIIDPTALIGGGIGVTKFITGSVKSKLAAKVGAEVAEEVVGRAESAFAREARAKAAGEAFDFTPLERQALEQIDDAAGDVTPFVIPDTPENRELVQLSLDGFEDGGRLVGADGPTTPVVVITDPVQADFIAVNGLDDVFSNVRETVSDGIDNLFGRGAQQSNDVVRATSNQIDDIQNPILRDAAETATRADQPVEVLTPAVDDVISRGDAARTLDDLAAKVDDKELPVVEQYRALFDDLLRANEEGDVALTITKDGRVYRQTDAPEDGAPAILSLFRDENGNLRISGLLAPEDISPRIIRQIDKAIDDTQPGIEDVVLRDSLVGINQTIAQSDALIGGRIPGEDGIGVDTAVPTGTSRQPQLAALPEPRVVTGPIQTFIDSISSITDRASEVIRETVSTKPVVKPVGPNESLQRITRVRQAVNQKQINDSELIQFWQSTVRDTDGRFSYYQGQVPPSYYRGAQPLPNLADPEIQRYLQANLDTREAFLKGLQEGKFKRDVDDFKEWLIDLHKKQAYKTNQLPGEIESAGFRISTDHTVIIRNDVLKLANKYGDTYADFLNSPNQFGFWKTLDLSEITESARPIDQVLDSGLIRHFYPEPQYFNEYFAAMQGRLIQLDQLGKDAPTETQLRLMADFYQYAANGRSFREVNQSLYMNMVNGMLEERGLKPIEHGIMDFVALRLEPANFQKYFIEEVQRAQNSTRRLLSGEPCPIVFSFIPTVYAQSNNHNPCRSIPVVSGVIDGVRGAFDRFNPGGQSEVNKIVPKTPTDIRILNMVKVLEGVSDKDIVLIDRVGAQVARKAQQFDYVIVSGQSRDISETILRKNGVDPDKLIKFSIQDNANVYKTVEGQTTQLSEVERNSLTRAALQRNGINLSADKKPTFLIVDDISNTGYKASVYLDRFSQIEGVGNTEYAALTVNRRQVINPEVAGKRDFTDFTRERLEELAQKTFTPFGLSNKESLRVNKILDNLSRVMSGNTRTNVTISLPVRDHLDSVANHVLDRIYPQRANPSSTRLTTTATKAIRFDQGYPGGGIEEFEALSRLYKVAPENIVKPLELVKEGDQIIGYKTEPLNGIIASKYVDLYGGLPQDYKNQIVSVLETLHVNGLAHGDPRLANILITPDGKVKLMVPVAYTDFKPEYAKFDMDSINRTLNGVKTIHKPGQNPISATFDDIRSAIRQRNNPCPVKFGVITKVYAQIPGSDPCPTNPFAAIFYNAREAGLEWFNRIFNRGEKSSGTIVPAEQVVEINSVPLDRDRYTQQGFNAPQSIKEVKGPLVEIAGPTQGGYRLVDTNDLNKKLFVSNKKLGCPLFNPNTGERAGYIGSSVDFRADATKLPFKAGSVGAVFVSCLGPLFDDPQAIPVVALRKSAIEEAGRVLEPNGFLVWQGGSRQDILNAEQQGFKIVEYTRSDTNSYNIIFQKAPITALVVDTRNINTGDIAQRLGYGEEIGEGSYADVFEAQAGKVAKIFTEYSDDDIYLNQRQIDTLKLLTSKYPTSNIFPKFVKEIYATDSESGQKILIGFEMEEIEGQTLSEFIDKGGILNKTQVQQVLAEHKRITDEVGFPFGDLAQAGTRDPRIPGRIVKNNIMIKPSGQIVFIDISGPAFVASQNISVESEQVGLRQALVFFTLIAAERDKIRQEVGGLVNILEFKR